MFSSLLTPLGFQLRILERRRFSDVIPHTTSTPCAPPPIKLPPPAEASWRRTPLSFGMSGLATRAMDSFIASYSLLILIVSSPMTTRVLPIMSASMPDCHFLSPAMSLYFLFIYFIVMYGPRRLLAILDSSFTLSFWMISLILLGHFPFAKSLTCYLL
jgi:hypothetical protein